jgi:hypothetical protein
MSSTISRIAGAAGSNLESIAVLVLGVGVAGNDTVPVDFEYRNLRKTDGVVLSTSRCCDKFP